MVFSSHIKLFLLGLCAYVHAQPVTPPPGTQKLDTTVCTPLPFIPSTYGGNSNNAPCKFPFNMGGQSYTKCTLDNRAGNQFWCATTSDYDKDGKWGYCTGTVGGTAKGQPCVFPFTYKGKTYNKCFSEGKVRQWCATTSNFDKDKLWGYCPDTGKDFPELPDTFQVKIQWQMVSQNSSVYLEEFFDQEGDRAAIHAYGLQAPGVQTKYISNYKTNEFFNVVDEDTCYVSNLSKAIDLSFPYRVVNGTDHVLSAGDALQFGQDFQSVYVGPDSVNGIAVEHWQSCVFRPDLGNATINIDYYFTDPRYWQASEELPSVPVMAFLYGHSTDEYGARVDINQVYDFAFFSSFLPDDPSIFETPKGVVCQGRINTKPLPQVPRQFSFRIENVDPNRQLAYFMDEWYDYDAKLFRMDFKPLDGSEYAVFGKNPMTLVHDFNTGTAYLMDFYYGNCTVMPIDMFGQVDTENVAWNITRIRTPQEFFDFDSYNYYYEGQRVERNILVDVWVSQRLDWPDTNSDASNWEWSFSANGWSLEDGHKTEKNEPVKLDVYVPSSGQQYIANIYNFDNEIPDYSIYDVSLCFQELRKRMFQFQILGDYKYVEGNLFTFNYLTLSALEGFTGLRPIRVQDVQVDYNQNTGVIFFSFTMLDKSPVSGMGGGDVKQPVKEVELDVAAKLLESALNSNNLTILMTNDGFDQSTVILRAQPYTLREVIRHADGSFTIEDFTKTSTPAAKTSTTGAQPYRPPGGGKVTYPRNYTPTPRSGNGGQPCNSGQVGTAPAPGMSSGSAAGLGIGMFLVGGVLGLAVAYLYWGRGRRRLPLKYEKGLMERGSLQLDSISNQVDAEPEPES